MFQQMYQSLVQFYHKIISVNLDFMATTFEVLLKSIGIFIIAGFAVKIGRKIIKKVFVKQQKWARNVPMYAINNKRIDTLTTLTASIYSYVIYIMSFVSVLTYATRALHLESVLAAFGIGGLAIALSAQNSIRDMLSGIYILFDDPFAVGDTVSIDGISGKVEEVGLRVTKIRADAGDLFVIANGDIRKLLNQSRGHKNIDVDIPLAHTADFEKASQIIHEVCESVRSEFDSLVEGPSLLGITDLGKAGAYNMKVTGKAQSGKQWEVERKIREEVARRFLEAGIRFTETTKFIIT